MRSVIIITLGVLIGWLLAGYLKHRYKKPKVRVPLSVRSAAMFPYGVEIFLFWNGEQVTRKLVDAAGEENIDQLPISDENQQLLLIEYFGVKNLSGKIIVEGCKFKDGKLVGKPEFIVRNCTIDGGFKHSVIHIGDKMPRESFSGLINEALEAAVVILRGEEEEDGTSES